MVIFLVILVFLAFALLPASFYTVQEKYVKIIQRLGRHHKISGSGFHLKIPFIDTIAARLPLRILELVVKVETKTKDNVFVRLDVAVQYQVEDPYRAFYELTYPEAQIESYVFDVVRAQVPLLPLDEVFETKDEVANAVKNELSQAMDDFGYKIIKALVTDIDPAREVKDSMNRINASERLRIAAENEADAEKIRVVKAAEAQAESKRLQGEGIAEQRKAIALGLRESTQAVKESMDGVSDQEVMKILLLTQHYDTMEAMSRNSSTRTIFVNPSPSGLADVSSQITKGVMEGNEATAEIEEKDAIEVVSREDVVIRPVSGLNREDHSGTW